jgi:hypothetical protein
MRFTMKALVAAVAVMTMYGCGGDGGGGGGPVADSYVFPAGKATLVFSAISTAQLPAGISGVDFSITLPLGMGVTTASGGTALIDSASVTSGSALTGTNLAFGSYSASSRKAHLSMATASNTFRSGEFLRLSCNVNPDTSITLGDLKALNAPVTLQKVVGYDPVSKSTVIFTSKVKVTLGAWN